jgi:hypothetical protein
VPSSTSSHITVVAVDVLVEVTDAVDCVVCELRVVSRGLRVVVVFVVVVVSVTGSPGVLGPSSVQAQGVCSLYGSRGSTPGVQSNWQAAQYSCFL